METYRNLPNMSSNSVVFQKDTIFSYVSIDQMTFINTDSPVFINKLLSYRDKIICNTYLYIYV